MSKTLKQFIIENTPEQVAEERMPERDVMAHEIDPKTWQHNLNGADEVEAHDGGEFTFYRGFYYKHGDTSQKHADRISTELDKLGIKHTVVGHDERYGTAPFRGGAPGTKYDHFSVRVKIHPGQATRIGEDGGIQRHLDENIGEFGKNLVGLQHAAGPKPVRVTESEKPFIAVKLIPGRTTYKVVQSTHPDIARVGEELSDTDYDELEAAHPHDIHFENRSKRGSGPGSKSGKAQRKH